MSDVNSLAYPVRVDADYPQASSRGLALLGALFLFPKILLLIPHLFILYFINLAAFLLMYVGYWAVVFTGRYPRTLFDFALGALRWQTRTNAWLWGLTDRYPPFTTR